MTEIEKKSVARYEWIRDCKDRSLVQSVCNGYSGHLLDYRIDRFSEKESHKQGYAPKPPEPTLATWRAPGLTEQEQQERNQHIKSGELPF